MDRPPPRRPRALSTAATIIPAVGVVSYGVLFRPGLLSITAAAAAATAITGIVVFAPLFMLIVRLARYLDLLL